MAELPSRRWWAECNVETRFDVLPGALAGLGLQGNLALLGGYKVGFTDNMAASASPMMQIMAKSRG